MTASAYITALAQGALKPDAAQARAAAKLAAVHNVKSSPIERANNLNTMFFLPWS